MTAERRMDLFGTTPGIYRAMRDLEQTVTAEAEDVGLEAELRELVKIRASQLNGCAICIDMLSAWREAERYSERERAALALAESVTFVHEGHVPGGCGSRHEPCSPSVSLPC